MKIGIQLYNFRELFDGTPENFKDVLLKVQSLGYEGVEFAGFYGIVPERIKQILEETGLEAIGVTASFTDMEADIDKVINDCRTLGAKYIVLLYLPLEFQPGAGKYDYVLKSIRGFAEKAKAAGLTMLYHNHDFEFYRMSDGEYALDMMYRTIPTELLKTELDTCWIRVSGEDPVAYLKKYADRCPLVHLKDYYKEDSGIVEFKPLGDGVQDCKAVLDAAVETIAEWIIVEQDEPSEKGPLEDAERSMRYIRRLF